MPADAEVKAVEMERVFYRSRVEHAEVNRITLGQGEALVVRPGFSVEDQHRLELAHAWRLEEPFADHPDPFVGRFRLDAGRIHGF